jgi:hypothetical protein
MDDLGLYSFLSPVLRVPVTRVGGRTLFVSFHSAPLPGLYSFTSFYSTKDLTKDFSTTTTLHLISIGKKRSKRIKSDVAGEAL